MIDPIRQTRTVAKPGWVWDSWQCRTCGWKEDRAVEPPTSSGWMEPYCERGHLPSMMDRVK